jgi:hypothetical protein
MARAIAAAPNGFPGLRKAAPRMRDDLHCPVPGQLDIDSVLKTRKPYYLPNKGGYFANRLITHRTKCIFDARERAEKHLADNPGNQFLIDFLDTLDHFLYMHGSMNIYLRYCHG